MATKSWPVLVKAGEYLQVSTDRFRFSRDKCVVIVAGLVDNGLEDHVVSDFFLMDQRYGGTRRND